MRWSTWALFGWVMGCVEATEAPAKADEEADTDADADADSDADADADADSGEPDDTGAPVEFDYVVDQMQVTWALGLVGGAHGDVPGVAESVRLHFTEARRWRDDFNARRGQCVLVLDPSLAAPVDWYADVPTILAAWELADAGAAIQGVEGDCDQADLSALGGDPEVWLAGKVLGFGIAHPTEEARAAYAARFSDYEALAPALLQGIIHTDYDGTLRFSGEQYVLGFETDGLGVVEDEAGVDQPLDTERAIFLSDGYFVGRPFSSAFGL